MKSLLRSGIAVLGLASCYSQPKPFVRMAGSSDVPAAEGKVTATAGDNMNTNLEVNVDHLAPPERVRQGATTYVVWARARGANDYQNVGALLVDNNLHGHLKTVTALQDFDVMITVEQSPTVQEPSSKRVLSAQIER